jgi:hypothetical protein
VGVMESMGVDDEPVDGIMLDIFFRIVGLDSFLHSEAIPGGSTSGSMTRMLGIEFKHEILTIKDQSLQCIY